MMISPELFYEDNIKGKTEIEIKENIRSIKREINKLKKNMEAKYCQEIDSLYEMCPSESTQLHCNRMYLKVAQQGLRDIGDEYIPSREEVKSNYFQENIVNIREILFTIGGYTQGHKNIVVQLNESCLNVTLKHFEKLTEGELKTIFNEVMDREYFLNKIKELYLGEWKSVYSSSEEICDGTQWKIEIVYINGIKSRSYEGDNMYPYNFDEFLKLLNLENEI